MSEYPIHCDKCGKYLGLVHATEYGTYLCEECERAGKTLSGNYSQQDTTSIKGSFVSQPADNIQENKSEVEE